MKYEDVNTPEELLRFMQSNIHYGFVDDDDEIYTPSMVDFNDKVLKYWHISKEDRLLSSGYGNCFDQVELERAWFQKNGYSYKTFFVWFELDYENPYVMHSYLVYENDGKFYYFENADDKNRGIKEFDTYLDAVEYQMKKHLILNNEIKPLAKNEIESIHVYEYNSIKENVDFYGFIDTILEEGILWL